jgi:hypothetical protein
MELASGILTRGQIITELQGTPELLASYGYAQVIVYFGFGSCGNIDELWKEIQIEAEGLLQFAENGERRGLFEPGRSDLYIEAKDGSLLLQFCHDSDIHFRSENEALAAALESRWREKGFAGYRKVGEEWVPFEKNA